MLIGWPVRQVIFYHLDAAFLIIKAGQFILRAGFYQRCLYLLLVGNIFCNTDDQLRRAVFIGKYDRKGYPAPINAVLRQKFTR